MSDIWQTGTLFIKELDILDCAVFCPKHGIKGASWHVDIEIEGKLDENGFVYDFSHTKKLVKEVLKTSLDHALILPKTHEQITYDVADKRISLEISSDNGIWKYKAPEQSVFLMDASSVTPKTVALAAEKVIAKSLPKTVEKVKIHLHDEVISDGSGVFRYTHGLPHHKGLCQRLFHGHRSKLIIELDDVKSTEAERLVTRDWFADRIHIAEPGQFKSEPWAPYSKGKEGEYSTLHYHAEEGYFEATIPSHNIYIVEQATSIESISQGLCKALKASYPQSTIRVIAHEGINKGGIATI